MTEPHFHGQAGVSIAGTGLGLPEGRLTNADLEKIMDTSDEWIVQRTGIRERRKADPDHESQVSMATKALDAALSDAGMKGSDLDLVINGTCSPDSTVPSGACRVAANVGATPAGAFDLVAACSSFVYALNVADTMVRSGRAKTVGVIGCEFLTRMMDYNDRRVSILFGDGAGAAVVTADEDTSRGCLWQMTEGDGRDWEKLYRPMDESQIPEWDKENPIRPGCVRMSGQDIYRFAVTKFGEVIASGLEATALKSEDISQFICHQSNIRILQKAMERNEIPDEKLRINIDRYGNTSAASVPIILHELRSEGKLAAGDLAMFVAFGAGLTWAANVWRV